jgi:hypothetical protein
MMLTTDLLVLSFAAGALLGALALAARLLDARESGLIPGALSLLLALPAPLASVLMGRDLLLALGALPLLTPGLAALAWGWRR